MGSGGRPLPTAPAAWGRACEEEELAADDMADDDKGCGQ